MKVLTHLNSGCREKSEKSFYLSFHLIINPMFEEERLRECNIYCKIDCKK